MVEYIVLVSRPKKPAGEWDFKTLEELRGWLDSKFYISYKKQKREDMIKSMIESLEKFGHVEIVNGWYEFSIKEKKVFPEDFSLRGYIQGKEEEKQLRKTEPTCRKTDFS